MALHSMYFYYTSFCLTASLSRALPPSIYPSIYLLMCRSVVGLDFINGGSDVCRLCMKLAGHQGPQRGGPASDISVSWLAAPRDRTTACAVTLQSKTPHRAGVAGANNTPGPASPGQTAPFIPAEMIRAPRQSECSDAISQWEHPAPQYSRTVIPRAGVRAPCGPPCASSPSSAAIM